MTNVQAAILYGQLQDAEEIRDKKSHIFEIYRKELKNVQSISLQEADNSVHSNWMFGIRVHNNKGYKHAESFFKENKIETRPMFYPASTHKYLKNYKQVNFGSETNSLTLNRECLLLPSYPSLTNQDLNHIISSVKRYAIYDK